MPKTEIAGEYKNWCLLGGPKGLDVVYDRVGPFLEAERLIIAERLRRHPDLDIPKEERAFLENFDGLTTKGGRKTAGDFLCGRFDIANQALKHSDRDLTSSLMGYDDRYDPSNDLMVLNASFRALLVIGQLKQSDRDYWWGYWKR